MAWTYGFFNSLNGDRVYNADQMSKMFEGLITSGVYESVGDKLAVQPNNGMTIQIATGRGWFDSRWVNNDAPYLLTLANADTVLNRYAAICIRVDSSNGTRSAVPYVKYSDFASSPTKPTMTRTDELKEYCLAYVYIPAKATAISAGNIEDTRFNNTLCGWVTGLITQVSTTTLFNQWQALFEGFLTQSTETFNTWYSGLVDIIDDNVETMLVSAMTRNITLTLPRADWSSNQQSVTIVGMSATKTVIVDSADVNYKSASVRCTGQALDTLTFTCNTLPSADVTVNVTYSGI